MMSHFPIFIDLHRRPPLVIGDDAGLGAKLRLLQKAAPQIDVMTSDAAIWGDDFANQNGDRFLPGFTTGSAMLAGDDSHLHAAIKGRGLVILETGDADRNAALVRTANLYGVPVNVPDNLALCSFYLASIVDRAPLIIAISTSGAAPVLGQVIRARLETMLVPHYGKLAAFLKGLRPRLASFAPAKRRQLQRNIVTGQVGRRFLAGDHAGVEHILQDMLALNSDDGRENTGEVKKHSLALISYGTGQVNLLSLGAAEAIRVADIIFYDTATHDEILEIARREANIKPLDMDPSGPELAARLKAAHQDEPDAAIVWLGGNAPDHYQTGYFQMLLARLDALGCAPVYWPAAMPMVSAPILASPLRPQSCAARSLEAAQ